MKRFVIIDRDGTIIEERHHLSRVDDVALIPGAASAIARMHDMGFGVVVVTNQSVVGRGLVDEAGLEAIHNRVRQLLAAEDASVDAIYHCPHLPDDGCRCRKPLPGLVERAGSDLGFDPERAFLVGDHAGDMQLGRAVGATTVFVLTGHGREERRRAAPLADHVAADLEGAAAIIRDVVSEEAI